MRFPTGGKARNADENVEIEVVIMTFVLLYERWFAEIWPKLHIGLSYDFGHQARKISRYWKYYSVVIRISISQL